VNLLELASSRQPIADDRTRAEIVASESDWTQLVAQDAWILPRPKSPAPDAALSPEPSKAPEPNDVKNIGRLEQAVGISDKTDTTTALNRIVEGQNSSLDLIEVMTQPGLPADRRSVLSDMTLRVHAEKWHEFELYLDPALTRAELAFSKIASGNDEQIREGEKLLVTAVSIRPELQLNEAFQHKVITSYQKMELERKSSGLPPWNGELTVAKPATTNGTTVKPADSIAKANLAYREAGIHAAIPHFEAAIRDADAIPKDGTVGELTELFCKRLAVEREIIAREVRGQPIDKLITDRNSAKNNEWARYREYLSPASTRVNMALAMISSGDPDLLRRGKTLLGEAIRLRPELEFDGDYHEHVKNAFENHHKYKTATTAPATDNPGANTNRPEEKFEVGYKEIAPKDLGKGSTDLENDKKVSSYIADSATGPVLTAALLFLGYRAAKGQFERFRARRTAASSAQSASGTETVLQGTSTNTARSNEKPAEVKPLEVKPAEAKPAAMSELEIRTSPFESGNQSAPRLERPASAMETGMIIEINLPGGVVARIAKAEAPAYVERIEREFKTGEFSKVLDELISDKTRSADERRQLAELKSRYEGLPIEAREEAKLEFFRNIRAQMGIETEIKESEQGRTSRVGRTLAIGGGVLAVGILSSAVLRYCLQKDVGNATQDRVNVQFIKTP